MPTFNQHGDIIIEPGTQGLTFAVGAETPLTFADQRSPSAPWRWIVSSVISLLALSLPMASRAASYTGAELVARTNAVRTAQGLAVLNLSPELEQAAIAKANDMFANNYFGHYSPTGTSPWVFFKNAHYSYTAAGENLATDYIDGADIVPAWLSSKTHRDNLLNPNYRDIGIAVLDGTINGSPTTVVVQFFGSQQSTVVVPPASAPIKTATAVAAKPIAPKPTAQPAGNTPAPVKIPDPAPVSEPAVIETTVVQVIPTVQPDAEVKGLTAEVIPSLNLPEANVTNLDPRVMALILATLGLYATLLTTVGLLNGLIKHPSTVVQLDLGSVNL